MVISPIFSFSEPPSVASYHVFGNDRFLLWQSFPLVTSVEDILPSVGFAKARSYQVGDQRLGSKTECMVVNSDKVSEEIKK